MYSLYCMTRHSDWAYKLGCILNIALDTDLRLAASKTVRKPSAPTVCLDALLNYLAGTAVDFLLSAKLHGESAWTQTVKYIPV